MNTHTFHAMLTTCLFDSKTPTTAKTRRSARCARHPQTHVVSPPVDYVACSRAWVPRSQTLNNLILRSPQDWQTNVALPFVSACDSNPRDEGFHGTNQKAAQDCDGMTHETHECVCVCAMMNRSASPARRSSGTRCASTSVSCSACR